MISYGEKETHAMGRGLGVLIKVRWSVLLCDEIGFFFLFKGEEPINSLKNFYYRAYKRLAST